MPVCHDYDSFCQGQRCRVIARGETAWWVEFEDRSRAWVPAGSVVETVGEMR